MEIDYRISRTANEFFFISTLAAWHYSCRMDIRDAWLRIVGKLTPQEKESLASFADLMKSRYGFQSQASYLGNIFYDKEDGDIWSAVARFISNESDYKIVRNTFSLFDEKFEKIWKMRSTDSLSLLKRELKKKATTQFIDDVAWIFGGKTSPLKITLLILFSPLKNQTASGGANLGQDMITIELPILKKDTWQFAYSIAVIGHELGHLCFAKRNGKKLIQKIIIQSRLKKQYHFLPYNTLTILNEALTASFVPLGALGQKYLSRELSPLLFNNAPRIILSENQISNGETVQYYNYFEIWFIFHMFPLAEKYLQKRKKIDDSYIRAICSFIKSAEKRLRH